ncbi:MAG: bifunctional 3,4-dihydroxy-2-butanone-4-phosphate synthase/GTP cyclohydrolase II [Dehalococcoidia bacterium]|nr:bifunctional 3,4-dihydroxy-2-butanone-4-phosphate synthase/GTP cyclohydrolase II [Dehalococcoidia bacterium]
MKTNSIEEAIQDYKEGKFVVIVDDEDRENEGDITISADFITPEKINFMAVNARGLICVAIEGSFLDHLNIPLMVPDSNDNNKTAFTVSVDYIPGTTTGISSEDRANTVLGLINSKSNGSSFQKPGHIFPIKYRDGGVLVRAGHTEASVDLSKLAGLKGAAVMCEIINADGSMSRRPDLEKFAEKNNIKIITIADLISYRYSTENIIAKTSSANLPTRYGEFKALGYKSIYEDDEHVALVKGKINSDPTLVRVHSECLSGDFLGSLRCDCGDQASAALESIGKENTGVFLYMKQEGRGIGLHNKLKAYGLQDNGADTVEANEMLGFPADLRHYGVGAQILADIGLKKIRLLTNNPKKVVGLSSYGIEIVETVPINVEPNPINEAYLRTKKNKLGHKINNV